MVRLVGLATSALAIALLQAESVRAYGLRRNCEMSEWSPWEACGPDGYRTRSRSVVVPPSVGGSPCPATEAHEKCTPDDWWMNAWGGWVCDDTTGMKSRSRTVAKRGRGGRKCPALVETAVCDPVPCVVNSVSEDTGAWGACQWNSRSSQWVKSKVLGIKTPAKYGGICAPASDSSRRVKEVCAPVNCVVNSVAEDNGAWSACTTNSDGETYKTKVLGIKTPQQFGGSCPSVDDEARIAREPCAAIDCEVNSEEEDTGNWDPCQPDESGQWFQRKVLGIKSPEQYGGSCPSDSERTARKLCAPVDCEINSVEEDVGTWDSCQDDGTGRWVQKKVLGVKTPEQYGGSCPSTSDEARIATQLCPPVDCELNSEEEDTGTFDSCQDNGKGQWFQNKVLGVKTPEQFGGSCPSTSDPQRIVSKFCPPVDCVVNSLAEDKGSWDSCQDDGSGKWFQKKVLGVKTPEQNGGTCPLPTDPCRIATQLCPPVNCVIKTPAEDRGTYSTCSRGVKWESKYKVKVLAIKVPAMYGGTPCPPTSARLIKQYCGFLEYLDMLREYDAFVLSGGDTQIKEGLPYFTASQNGGGVSFGAMLPYNAVSSPKAITFSGPACGTGKRKLSVTLVCGTEVKLTPATRKSNCEWTTTLAMPVKEICPTFGPTL